MNFSLLGEIDIISEYLIIAQGRLLSIDVLNKRETQSARSMDKQET